MDLAIEVRKDQYNSILSFIHQATFKKLQSLFILGPPGSLKTTIARKIYNDVVKLYPHWVIIFFNAMCEKGLKQIIRKKRPYLLFVDELDQLTFAVQQMNVPIFIGISNKMSIVNHFNKTIVFEPFTPSQLELFSSQKQKATKWSSQIVARHCSGDLRTFLELSQEDKEDKEDKLSQEDKRLELSQEDKSLELSQEDKENKKDKDQNVLQKMESISKKRKLLHGQNEFLALPLYQLFLVILLFAFNIKRSKQNIISIHQKQKEKLYQIYQLEIPTCCGRGEFQECFDLLFGCTTFCQISKQEMDDAIQCRSTNEQCWLLRMLTKYCVLIK